MEVYLEPGEASVYHAGVLVSTVLDIVKNEMEIAIMDTSAETHMPDVLLMPYRPLVLCSAEPGEKRHTYRLAGPSCLAGDIIGDYSFEKSLKRGDRLVLSTWLYASKKHHLQRHQPSRFNGGTDRAGEVSGDRLQDYGCGNLT